MAPLIVQEELAQTLAIQGRLGRAARVTVAVVSGWYEWSLDTANPAICRSK